MYCITFIERSFFFLICLRLLFRTKSITRSITLFLIRQRFILIFIYVNCFFFLPLALEVQPCNSFSPWWLTWPPVSKLLWRSGTYLNPTWAAIPMWSKTTPTPHAHPHDLQMPSRCIRSKSEEDKNGEDEIFHPPESIRKWSTLFPIFYHAVKKKSIFFFFIFNLMTSASCLLIPHPLHPHTRLN